MVPVRDFMSTVVIDSTSYARFAEECGNATVEEKVSSRSSSGVSGCSKSTSVATVEAIVEVVCVLACDFSDTEDLLRSWLTLFVVG